MICEVSRATCTRGEPVSLGLAENFLMMSIFVSDLRAISIGIVADKGGFANRHEKRPLITRGLWTLSSELSRRSFWDQDHSVSRE